MNDDDDDDDELYVCDSKWWDPWVKNTDISNVFQTRCHSTDPPSEESLRAIEMLFQYKMMVL